MGMVTLFWLFFRMQRYSKAYHSVSAEGVAAKIKPPTLRAKVVIYNVKLLNQAFLWLTSKESDSREREFSVWSVLSWLLFSFY